MAKIKLGDRPKNFKKVVRFEMLDGTTGEIEVAYKYRTRTDFGKFIDRIIEASGSKEKATDETFSMARVMEKTADSNADYILDVIDEWNLDSDLTRSNVQQLCDEVPAAANQIMETYRLACTEGRLGN